MNTPRIGEMKERINLIEVTSPFNIYGEGTLASTFASNVPAKIEYLAGGENEETEQVQSATQGFNVWIRYKAGVTAFQQIVWGSRRLVMTGPPEEIVRRRWILIHAKGSTDRKL